MPPAQHLADPLAHDDLSPYREQVAAAVAALPAEEHERLLAEIVLTTHRCSISRDYGPLRHLVDSFFATSWLHRSEDYRRARQDALQSDMTELVDGDEFLEQLKGAPFPRP